MPYTILPKTPICYYVSQIFMFWMVLCKGDSQLVFLPLVFAIGFVFRCYSGMESIFCCCCCGIVNIVSNDYLIAYLAMWYESEFFLHNSVLLASLSIFVGE